ncbi:MAG TPA: hypothetical protein PK165_03450 [bacterium]|nr:hypothetical protein [bacterium]HPO51872.1 hypothetical protein [bacterium]HXK44515.1 hypothetical protein [bacterium]
MKKIISVLFIGFAIVFTGCAIHPGFRAEREGRSMITDYPMNKVAVVRAIDQHRVIYGMTMEEVIASWGEPELQHELIINGKVYQSWAYRKNNRTHIIYFHHGIVVDIR